MANGRLVLYWLKVLLESCYPCSWFTRVRPSSVYLKLSFPMTGLYLSHLIIGVMRLQWRLTFAKWLLHFFIRSENFYISAISNVLCLFWQFLDTVHLLTSRILQLLDDDYIDVVFVPPNCTNQPQPLHLSFNKAVKDFMQRKFQKWYSNQGLDDGSRAGMKPIHFPMSQMKPLGAQWLIELHQHNLCYPFQTP